VLVSDDRPTALERALDARGVRYEVARVDGYVIVHPLDGPVDPAIVANSLWNAC
jgi:hypothetical protein